MRRGHLTFTGATGQYFKLLHRLAEFTPLSLTALGPTFRKSGSSFSLAHLEQFYLAWLEIFKMQGKGTFVPWLNESLGLYCPEQCQSTLFSITSPTRKHFFLLVLIAALTAWIGWTLLSCRGSFLFLGHSCVTTVGHPWGRFSAHIVMWTRTYSLFILLSQIQFWIDSIQNRTQIASKRLAFKKKNIFFNCAKNAFSNSLKESR